MPDFGSFLLAAQEVLGDLLTMAKVVGDHGVDVRECQRFIALSDRFRGRPIFERINDQLEEHPSITDAQGSRTVFPNRDGLDREF